MFATCLEKKKGIRAEDHVINYERQTNTVINHYLVVEILPVVLCHQAKQGEKGPPEGVEAGVAVVGVPSRLQTVKPIWTLSAKQTHAPTHQHKYLHFYLCLDIEVDSRDMLSKILKMPTCHQVIRRWVVT